MIQENLNLRQQKNLWFKNVTIVTFVVLFVRFSENDVNGDSPKVHNPTSIIPDDVVQLYLTAQARLEEGEYEKVIGILQSILSKHPNFIPAHLDIGMVRFRMKDYKGAIESLKVFLDYEPSHLGGLDFLGVCYAGIGDYESTIDTYNKAIRISSKNCDLIMNRGKAFFETGRFEKAAEDFKLVLKINRHYKSAHTMLGYANLRLKNVPDAMREFDEAIRSDEKDVLALVLQAVCYDYKGDENRSRSILKTCYKFHPKKDVEDRYETERQILSGKLVIQYNKK